MAWVQLGKVVEMNPGSIRADVRNSWGITLADGSKLLAVWDDELDKDAPNGETWVNLFDVLDPVRRPRGGGERKRMVEAILAGVRGWALLGTNFPVDGERKWWIHRHDIHRPYRITQTRTDARGTVWGKLERLEPRKATPPYRRGQEVAS